ncbi:MAG: DUF4405 domain-containing protein [Enterocloster asparagiformis]|nr:DUF4405 domain-containing protein [Enterocloster asparagiformis]
MDNRNRIKTIIDVIMCVLLPLLMAYSLLGETIHEWLGLGMLFAFILHHILNRQWFNNLFRGRYTPVRALYTAVNILLTLIMFALPISGIVMSKHVFTFFKGASWARLIHLLASYWGFLLMSVHLGLHLDMMAGKIVKNGQVPAGARVIVGILGLYGIYALFKRQIPSYLFLRNQFVFFDFGEAVFFFLFDYLTVMILFAAIGHGAVNLAKGIQAKNTRWELPYFRKKEQ